MVAFDKRFPGISIYEALTDDSLNEKEKAKIIAEAIDSISKEFPNLKHTSTKEDLKESELKLIKEIEDTRKEIKELELKLSKEIEDTRKEIKELELKLSKEIEDTRKEIKELELKLSKEMEETKLQFTKEIEKTKLELTKEIESSKVTMLKWSFIFWTTQMIALATILYKIL